MKQAANRPAPRDHSSDVSRYVAIAVKPLKGKICHLVKGPNCVI